MQPPVATLPADDVSARDFAATHAPPIEIDDSPSDELKRIGLEPKAWLILPQI